MSYSAPSTTPQSDADSAFPTTIFTLASGRSGTHFLFELIRRNARDCVSRHETYGWNPSMFGRPIYDHATDVDDRSRYLLARKRRIVERCGASFYVETSHAFLKSWYHLAPEFFPRIKLVHLVRNPLSVAKSEASREEWIKRYRIPFSHYRGRDGQRYFLWALTGLEPIYRQFDATQLTRLQWYLIQWIEIENRAMQFLDMHHKHADCVTLHSPAELNDPAQVRSVFEFLDLPLRQSELDLSGRRNASFRQTTIKDEDRRQFATVLQLLPSQYLEIFAREPYTRMPWADVFI